MYIIIAFYRFAASDSEDSSSGESDSEDDGLENRGHGANSSRGVSSIRSAQPLTHHHSPVVKVKILSMS